MALLAGADLPLAFVRQQLAGAVHLLVQVARLPDGRRRVGAVVELVGDDGGERRAAPAERPAASRPNRVGPAMSDAAR